MFANIMLGVLGVSAIWLSQSTDPRQRKWAPVLGLAGQPFWFWVSVTSEQWGIFVLCFFYTASWAKGFVTQWLRPVKLEQIP